MTPELVLDRFVGRKEELTALRECFEHAASGRPTFVAVSGEAGIGKSRLVREMLAALHERKFGLGVGHCLEQLKTPFFPLADIVRGLNLDLRFDAPSGDEPSTSGRSQKDRRLSNIRAIARALLDTSSGPRVVVIEDLHRADAATLGLLEYLGTSGAPGSLLVITTVRSELAERGGAATRVLSKLRVSGLISIRLAPLDDAEMTALLQNASPSDFSRAVLRRIKRLAEGNPLFAEELLRAAVDGNVLNPAYSSVRSTVLDRLYRLSEPDQRVIVCASVVGRFFDPHLVAGLVDRPFDDVVAALRRARNQQLVREQLDGSGKIAFRHGVFAEVVYAELLGLEARALHARIAKLIEENAGAARRTAELAYHYSKAGRPEKALAYNLRAGDEAMAMTAFEDAAGYYEQAVVYGSKGSRQSAELCEKLAYAWYAAGLAENTAALFSRALEEYEALHDDAKVVEMLLFLSRQAWNDAETPDGYRHAIRAAQIIGDRDPAKRDYAMTMAASYAVHMGHLDEAERIVRALRSAQPDIGARIVDTQAMLHARRGETAMALDLTARAQAIAKRSRDPDVLVRVFSNAADVQAMCQPRKTAADLWRQAYIAAQAGGYIGRMAYAALGYAAALIECGEMHRALELYDVAVETGATNASVLIQIAGVGAVLRALIGQPRAPRCDENVALHLALRSRESLRIGQLGGNLGFARVAEGRRDEARRVLGLAISQLESAAFSETLLYLGVVYGDSKTKTRAQRLLGSQADDSDNILSLCRSALGAVGSKVAARNGHVKQIVEEFRRRDCRILELITLEAVNDLRALRAAASSMGAHAYLSRIEGPAGKPTATVVKLTSRELEVAQLLADAQSNRTIAERLGISERTVEHHVESILSRLGIRSRWLVTPDLVARFE